MSILVSRIDTSSLGRPARSIVRLLSYRLSNVAVHIYIYIYIRHATLGTQLCVVLKRGEFRKQNRGTLKGFKCDAGE